MLIFGTRRVVHQMLIFTATCRVCGNRAAQSLRRAVTKFTLFFVPLFPVRARYSVQCSWCGASTQISEERATRIQATSAPVYSHRAA
jgi:transcription elongation factor Elf1